MTEHFRSGWVDVCYVEFTLGGQKAGEGGGGKPVALQVLLQELPAWVLAGRATKTNAFEEACDLQQQRCHLEGGLRALLQAELKQGEEPGKPGKTPGQARRANRVCV